MEANDFISDNRLNVYTINSTKLVIFDAVKDSNIYKDNLNNHCHHNIWNCFELVDIS